MELIDQCRVCGRFYAIGTAGDAGLCNKCLNKAKKGLKDAVDTTKKRN